MKISLNWLSRYVDLADLDPQEIAARLTRATAEVEGLEEIENSASHAVVAQILSISPVGPWNEKPLAAVVVDAGGSVFTTLSTAPNLSEGMLVAFAPPGATIGSGRSVEVAEMAGRRSEGILCSAAELGLGRFHETVLECPPGAIPGTRLSRWIPSRDVLIDFDNKSLTNRPDLWGHYGFAREFAAIFRRELRPLALVNFSEYEALPEYTVLNDDRINCPVYTCIAIDVARNAPSQLEMQAHLASVGQRSYNILVDVTNFVALELGQPTHAFDRDFIPQVGVKAMGRAAGFRTLDGEEHEMLPEDLMIWNDREPVAIAGIMGGLGSDIKPGTTHLLLESANFKASRVRRTSTRLALRTDASQRFEKGQPPSNTAVAAARIVQLLAEGGISPTAVSRFTVAGDLKTEARKLLLPSNYIRQMAGSDISDDRAVSILQSIGFGAEPHGDQLEVSIPPHRSQQDISLPADILEEVLRLHGYSEIEPRLPEAVMKPTPVNVSVRREHKARRILAEAHRFSEVQTYIWYDDAWLRQIGYDPGETLVLRNAIAEGKARLRTSLLPNILALVPQNLSNAGEFGLFEVGRVFVPEGNSHRETTRLCAVSFSPGSLSNVLPHYRAVRGALEDLGQMLAARDISVETATADGPAPWQTAGFWGKVMCAGVEIGAIGVLAGPAHSVVAPQGQTVWFDIAFEDLDGPLFPAVTYTPAPIYPGSWQDFSLLWLRSNGFAALEQMLGQFRHSLVSGREFLFDYQGKGLEPGMASYTFRYWLMDPERTLTSDDLEGFRSEFLEFLKSKNVSLR